MKKLPVVLGIDISYRSLGLVVMKGKKILKEIILQNPTGQLNGEYYSRIRYVLSTYIEQYKVEDAVIEDLNIRFLKVGKKLLPIHGIAKEVVHSLLGKEATTYNVSTWRFTILNLKKFTKEEKAEIDKLDIPKTHKKMMKDVKHKVIALVNKKLETHYTFTENDLADGAGLIIALYKHKYGVAL